MKNKSGFTMDFSQFEKDFNRIVKNVIPKEAGRGLFKAGNALLDDAVYVPPQTPKISDDLRGSKAVNEAKVTNGQISVEAGFNIEYAAYQHEGERKDGSHKIEKWTTTKGATSPGIKFLESKAAMFKNKYMEIAAKHIKGSAK